MQKEVSVIGGGIAGLSAAVFLADKGYKIRLFEASPKFGGRTYSFFDKTIEAEVDNGQHLLASWYKNTFDYLRIIGSLDKLEFQKKLRVNFIDNQANEYIFECPKLPPPFHLLAGIIKFKALKYQDKKALIRLVNLLKKQKVRDLENMKTDRLFSETGQTERLIRNFWEPFIIAVFNAKPIDTSAKMFADIIKTGFLEKGGSELVLPNDSLGNILVAPAIEYLKSKGSETFSNCRVTKINFEGNRISSIITEDNKEFKSNFYISAVPFFEFEGVFGESIYNRVTKAGNLKPSPIVNIHLRFEEIIDDVFTERFVGLLGTNVQWVFRSSIDMLSLVISSAGEIAEMDKELIVETALKELKMCITGFENKKLKASRVIKEMRATFVPDKESLSSRPDNATIFENFFIAGDWTNTGLPATIEGAVKSAGNCASEIEKSIYN